MMLNDAPRIVYDFRIYCFVFLETREALDNLITEFNTETFRSFKPFGTLLFSACAEGLLKVYYEGNFMEGYLYTWLDDGVLAYKRGIEINKWGSYRDIPVNDVWISVSDSDSTTSEQHRIEKILYKHPLEVLLSF